MLSSDLEFLIQNYMLPAYDNPSEPGDLGELVCRVMDSETRGKWITIYHHVPDSDHQLVYARRTIPTVALQISVTALADYLYEVVLDMVMEIASHPLVVERFNREAWAMHDRSAGVGRTD